MFILGDNWQNGFLDYYRPAGHVRIQVQAWWLAQQIADMYFVRSRDWRVVLNYWREVGARVVLSKIISRSKERLRNQRVIATGLGTVVDADDNCNIKAGQYVVFIAPNHPQCVERIVLPCELIQKADEQIMRSITKNKGIVFLKERIDDSRYMDLAGWSPYSGDKIPDFVPALLSNAYNRWKNIDLQDTLILPLEQSSPIEERKSATKLQGKRLQAVLFGLGNYAKTALIANLPSYINIKCVHEIDPTQIGKVDSLPYDIDTASCIRPDEKYDIYFIAGYHHTHTPLAVDAISRGGSAVVEKPIVTTWGAA